MPEAMIDIRSEHEEADNFVRSHGGPGHAALWTNFARYLMVKSRRR
jgi:hypothetical protein